MECGVCLITKPKEDFYYYNPHTCKKCLIARSTSWIKEHPDNFKASVKKWQKNNREVLNKADRKLRKSRRDQLNTLKAELGGRCSICGYNKSLYPLQFHHKNPDTKDFDIMTAETRLSIAKIAAELRKCILICRNCHIEIQYT